jgi:hypothetical protein
MALNLEHRRQNEQGFGWKKGLYIYGAGDVPEGNKSADVEAQNKAPKDGKKDEIKAEIRDSVFKAKYEAAKTFLSKNVDAKDGKQQELHKVLLTSITDDFNKLEGEYRGKVKELGKEDADKAFKKDLDEKADKLLQTVEHRILANMAMNPDKFQKEKADGLKTDLISHYLKSQGYGDSKEFAKYLLNSGVITEGISDENFDKEMQMKLTPEVVQNAVKKLTEDVRGYINSTPDEKAYIKGILEKPDMIEIVGNANVDKATEALTRQFHIEFKDGKPLFAVNTGFGSILTEVQLESAIKSICKVSLYSKETVDTYLEAASKRNENEEGVFKKMTEGKTFLNIGKVEDMSDVKDNKDLQLLLGRTNLINRARAKAEADLAKPETAKNSNNKTGETGSNKPAEETKLPEAERTALVEKITMTSMKEVDALIAKYPGIAKEWNNLWNKQELGAVISTFVSNFPDSDLIKIEKGIEPSREGYANAMKASMMKMLRVERLNNETETGKGIESIKKIDSYVETFGADSKVAEVISRTHVVKEESGSVMVDGKKVGSVKDLEQFMPEKSKAIFLRICDKQANEAEKEAFKIGLSIESYMLNDFSKMAEGGSNLKGAEAKNIAKAESSKELGGFEAIGVAVQMWGMIQAGDWESLGEAMEDFKKNNNPMKVMKECSDKYEAELVKNAPNSSVSDLLEAYLKPRGPEADKLFGNPNKGEAPLGRYRGAIREPIAKQIGDQLGIGPINKISRGDANTVIIEGNNKNGESVAFHLIKKDGRLVQTEGTIKENKDKDGKAMASTYPKPSGTPNDLGLANVTLGEVKKIMEAKTLKNEEESAIKAKEALAIELKNRPVEELLGKLGDQADIDKPENKSKKMTQDVILAELKSQFGGDKIDTITAAGKNGIAIWPSGENKNIYRIELKDGKLTYSEKKSTEAFSPLKAQPKDLIAFKKSIGIETKKN